MKLIKKILLILLFLLVVVLGLKFTDNYLKKKYGLGNPVLYLPSNIHGYLIKPNQKIVRRENIIEINNEGMRSNQNWKKDENSLNILFFGDSVTYGGSIVSNTDTFAENVCRNLKDKFNIEALCGNFGINGYNLESITRLIKFRKSYNKDLVVVTIIANDLERNFHNIASQPFWNKNVPTFLPAFTEGLFIVLEKFRLKVKYNFNENKKNNNENYYLYLIRNFSEALEYNNKEYIIFYSPESNELLNSQHKNNSIKKLLKNNLNNFYDLSEELKNYSMNDIYHDDIHLNKKGHQLYSDIMTAKILDFLKK